MPPDVGRQRISDRIASQAREREAALRIRRRRIVTRRDGIRCEVDGHWLANFCSNDYLGLSQQFAVTGALQDGAAQHGAGSGASHLVSGHHAAHDALERTMAEWLGYPRGLLFGSGYMANLAVVQAFLGEGDVCVQDRLNHASLIDAARLSGAALRRYPHADAEGALRQLRSVPDGAAILATDGVFSMDGDIAPLRDLAVVARVQFALLHVDDAHGIGIVGPEGRGSVAEARLGPTEVPLQLVTLGKALGGHGAVLVGDAALIEHLAQVARPYIYTTATPAAMALSSLEALKIARRDGWRRERVLHNGQRFQARMHDAGWPIPASPSAIHQVPCGSDAEALAMAAALEEQGFWVSAIRPPTVPEHGARLRVTFTALHTEADVDALVVALRWARDAVAAGYRAA